MNDISTLFAEDEKFIDFKDINPGMLLDQEGIISCSKTMDALGIERRKAFATLRKEAQKAGRGEEYFSEYGIKKYGTSRWFVHMPTFKRFATELRNRFPIIQKRQVSRVKKNISRQAFFNLSGIFLYRQVMEAGFLPFDPDQLIRHINQKELDPEDTGIWKESHEYYVDFKKFLAFAYSMKEGISLEEARKAVGMT